MFQWFGNLISNYQKSLGHWRLTGEIISSDEKLYVFKTAMQIGLLDQEAIFLLIKEAIASSVNQDTIPKKIRFTGLEGYIRSKPEFPTAWYYLENNEITIGELEFSNYIQMRLPGSKYTLSFLKDKTTNLTEIGIHENDRLITSLDGTGLEKWNSRFDGGIIFYLAPEEAIEVKRIIESRNDHN